MTQPDQSLHHWVLARLEAPVRDHSGLLAGSLDPGASAGEPTTRLGSAVLAIDRGALPLLRERLTDAVAGHHKVFVIATDRSNAPVPSEVLPVVNRVGANVTGLHRTTDGWAMALEATEGGADWRDLALSESAEADDLFGRIARAEETIAELHQHLAEAVDEQHALVSELDAAALRSAAVDEKLVELRMVHARQRELERSLSQAQDDNRRLRQELEQASVVAAEVARLRNDMERTRAELGALRARRDALQARQHRLIRDRAKLQHRLAIANWKLRRMANRRWWRLGQLLAGVARRPWALRRHASSVRQVLRPAPSEPRPTGQIGPTARTTSATDQDTPAQSGDAVVRVPPRPLRQVDAPRDMVVAAILDEMSAASFGPECQLVTITPSDWNTVLARRRPDLLLVESAWKGVSGSWEYQIGSYSHPESIGLPRLTEVVGWCREQGIPTVFWNKEDPVHFEKFAEAARLFDVIFTTDGECVSRYRALEGARAHTVAALPFAAQPRLHYPAPLEGRDPRPVFAGTFYRNRHPERRQQLEILLDGALAFDLRIFDRMGGQVTESFGYPERFQPSIQGGLPYSQMVEVYRRHRVFLNTNSVVDSPTMFSRRVFELLACGTPIVSTPSRGMEEMFGQQVASVATVPEVEKAIRLLVEDDAHWLRVSGDGFALVARHHLYEDRLRTIAESAGYRFPEARHAHVLGSTSRESDVWRDDAADATFVVFGSEERLAWAARVVGADIIGHTDDPRMAYRWADGLPDGELAVRRSLLEEGWSPAASLSPPSKVFLIPK